METILLGIALPVIYVSERQDGSLLVLDSSDRLRYLIDFLGGTYPVMELEFHQKLNGYNLEQMEQYFPRITSLLYNYKISFQIIEYTTPKHMHMQVGNYIEKWDFTREQGIRNKLYEGLEEFLDDLSWYLGQSADFFSRYRLNRQYMILRIFMYRFVFEKIIGEGQEEDAGLQMLLDQTTEHLKTKDEAWKMETAADIKEATKELMDWGRSMNFDLAKDRGKEGQARLLGYLYNVVWMSKKRGYSVRQGLVWRILIRSLWMEWIRLESGVNMHFFTWQNIRMRE